MFDAMRRGIFLVTLLLAGGVLMAQDTNPSDTPNAPAPNTAPPPTAAPVQPTAAERAAAQAAKQAADERYERMASDLQALQGANADLANKVAGLEDKVQKLRDQLASQSNDTSVQDALKRLSDKIEAVDRQREADKTAIADQVRASIAELEKTLGQSGPPAAVAPTPHERGHEHVPTNRTEGNVDAGPPPTDVANGFVYTVKQGDNLSLIVKAYNADFKSKGMKTISLRQAREANPKVDWNRLFVGQKIIIPRPAE